MSLLLRVFLHHAAGAAAFLTTSQIAWTQGYPSRPLRLIVGVTAGGANDPVARLVAQSLSERLGQLVVVENRPGAGGSVATEAVANADPNGYTLLFMSLASTIAESFNIKPGYNFVRDIVPIASLVRGPLVMEVDPSFPAKTVPEFIGYAKAHPGEINMASAGIGNTTHAVGELFMMLTGIKLTHVPYRGGAPAVTDLLAGQVQVYFDGISGSLDHIRTGRLRALAVTSATRADVLPSVPSLSEFVPGYDASGWYGIGAPKGTPAEVVDRLSTETNAVLADPRLQARLASLGYATVASSPAEFRSFIDQETEKWAEVIRFAGATPLLFDVRDEEKVQSEARRVRQIMAGSTIFGLVNNAGGVLAAPLLHQRITEVGAQIETNLLSLFIVTQAFAPLLGADRSLTGAPGRVVNVSSLSGKVGQPFAAAYTACKHGIEGFSESLRRELMLCGIAVIIVAPAFVSTPLLSKIEERIGLFADTESGADFDTALRAATKWGRQNGLPPRHVAEIIWRALSDRRPRLRYAPARHPVLQQALVRVFPARVLDRIWGAFVRRSARDSRRRPFSDQQGA